MVRYATMKRSSTFLILFLFISGAAVARDRYAVISLSGTVNPIMSQYIDESIGKANKEGMKFIVIQLDTPGGFVISMQEIVQSIKKSGIPVVVYTYPKGAHAASAGGYIMLAAHIAVMAPATNIGAMHPVGIMDSFPGDKKGDSGGVMGLKALNDLVAYARGLAQERNRNADWAERAVRGAISSTYLEALRERVIDFVAEDMSDLLRKLDNRPVNINGRVVVIRTAGCAQAEISMDWKQRLLNFFADPQMVLVLLVLAVVGIGMEIKSPGFIVPGVLGGISLFLFLMAIRILPVNAAGIALIVLAVVLFILELKITSYGLLTIGGAVSFIFGSLILFDSPLKGGFIPIASILMTVLLLLGFFFLVVRAVIAAHRGRVTTGIDGMKGESGTVLADFDASGAGKIKVHAEIWDARCGETVRTGDEVSVVDVDGMALIVKKK